MKYLEVCFYTLIFVLIFSTIGLSQVNKKIDPHSFIFDYISNYKKNDALNQLIRHTDLKDNLYLNYPSAYYFDYDFDTLNCEEINNVLTTRSNMQQINTLFYTDSLIYWVSSDNIIIKLLLSKGHIIDLSIFKTEDNKLVLKNSDIALYHKSKILNKFNKEAKATLSKIDFPIVTKYTFLNVEPVKAFETSNYIYLYAFYDIANNDFHGIFDNLSRGGALKIIVKKENLKYIGRFILSFEYKETKMEYFNYKSW